MKSTVLNPKGFYRWFMFCLTSGLLAMLFMRIVLGNLSVATCQLLDMIYVGSVCLLVLEQVARLARTMTDAAARKQYWNFEKLELFWLISTVPLFFFLGDMPWLAWLLVLKFLSVLNLFDDENVFQITVKILSMLLVAFFVVPFLNVFSSAISAPGQLIGILPQNIDLWALKYVLADPGIWRAFGNSLFVVTVGTIISVSVMCAAAFPLSKADMPFRKSVMIFFTIGMLFSGGMAPKILLADAIGIMDTIWALILPQVVIVYHMILLKSFFETIPIELEESAKLDGASNFQVLWHIIIPMSKPMIASIVSFTVVCFWNDINASILYLTASKDLYPVPMYVRDFLNMNPVDISQYSPQLSVYWEPLKMSYILVSILPIIAAYPLIFKYMKSDISAGAVKG